MHRCWCFLLSSCKGYPSVSSFMVSFMSCNIFIIGNCLSPVSVAVYGTYYRNVCTWDMHVTWNFTKGLSLSYLVSVYRDIHSSCIWGYALWYIPDWYSSVFHILGAAIHRASWHQHPFNHSIFLFVVCMIASIWVIIE